ncbi:OLC1v1031142C1 [Oldenlandia corymbosa var. corymbosa]|uniref:OLC1v1031142C1 n=1 Tax=Oldenlandia corymbosa var. corymbosa TaxID=529605 RepID=A0AAV1CKS8_OLDCO|nr:OLC1v1031142C1 [Oldenlandia corymbosa var. corymbosa]
MAKRAHSSSEDDSDFSEYDVDEWTETLYKSLRNGGHEVQVNGNKFTCPFCEGGKKSKFEYVELLQHANGASGLGKHSMQKRANHLALARYLQNDLAPVARAEIDVPAVHHAEVVVDPFQYHNPHDHFGHLGITIVHFRIGLHGLTDALAFNKVYKNDHNGKHDWVGYVPHDDSLYVWVAQEDDYESTGIFGRNLRKYGGIKSLGKILSP